MIEFIAGMGCALFIVIFIGWVDVFVFKKPTIHIKDNPIIAYIVITVWEFLFFLCGFVLGKFIF